MARKKKSADSGGGGANWMDTYGDLVTLLLCFFVLLFASSTISEEKWQAIVTAFTGSPANAMLESVNIETVMTSGIMQTQGLQQSEDELLKSDNPFAMVVLIARSVLNNKQLDDAALMEIKKRLAKELFKKSYSKEKIYNLLTFLMSYIRFENEENNLIFEENLDQITGRKKTMGIVEMVIAEREERAMERAVEREKQETVVRMIRKNFTDEVIADVAEVPLEYVQRIKSQI